MDVQQGFDSFNQVLEEAGLNRTRFMRISGELLGRGTIYHRASEVQAELYRDAMKILDLLQAYWGFSGYSIEHDVKSGHIMMYPPGAEIPGRQSDEQFESTAVVRRRMGADLAALIIILRQMYEEAVTRGAVEEEGEVPVKIEDVNAKMGALLKRDLPKGQVERLKLLSEARYRNLILFGDDAHQPEAATRIAIQPTIMGILGAGQCSAAIQDAQSRLIAKVGVEGAAAGVSFERAANQPAPI
jgi:hypothetical protein